MPSLFMFAMNSPRGPVRVASQIFLFT
jgi:hypothetical protein